MFTLPETLPEGVWQPPKATATDAPKNCQITIHSGHTESIVAMATIDVADLKELVGNFHLDIAIL